MTKGCSTASRRRLAEPERPFDRLRTGLLDSRLRGNDGLGPFDKLRVSG